MISDTARMSQMRAKPAWPSLLESATTIVLAARWTSMALVFASA